MNEYEALRAANIKRNQELLASLEVDLPYGITKKPKAKVKKAPTSGKKRKAAAPAEGAKQPSKKFGVASASEADDTHSAAGTVRRSSRNTEKPRVDYNESSNDGSNVAVLAKSRMPRVVIPVSDREHVGNRLGKRTHDPAECSTDAVHAPFVAGIAGSATEGAYSVALSGGYDDDVDWGYAFTYTGSGGRDLKGTKNNPKNLRTAPQSSDQTFDNPMNAALKTSAETKKPIRVIRGYKLDSIYAPESGYRYDGLYTVEKAWIEPGLNKAGYKVCKFAFKRIDGQPPLPTTAEDDDDEGSEENAEDSKD